MELRNERRNERKKNVLSQSNHKTYTSTPGKNTEKKRSNQCVKTETEQQPTETIKKRNF